MMNSPYEYSITLPEKMENGRKYPVIIALHGIGFDEQFLMKAVSELQEDFIIIGVRGDLPYEKGYAYYYLKGYGNPERDQFDSSIEKLKEYIDYSIGKYPIDQTKVYLMGFSQGAILSMSLALILGEKVKGIIPMNGYIPEFIKFEYPLKPIDHLNVFLCQGENDPIFPLNVGQANYNYFRDKAESVKYTIYPTEHKITKNNQYDVVAWLRHELEKISSPESKSGKLVSKE
ncbi:alpha/beta hydrolase [Bacillus tuaregi]|uniref:alpha/beta hydrolase n=1 Tax=Bacillus tuaregi TaxID=1816695 RepID=UPI000A00A007|nr:alpha/beta hydrolase-fold protein [Bacillus tuaregi]